MFGRAVMVLEGNMEPIAPKKHQAGHFTMWVDKQTGVLLMMEETNASGQVVNRMEVQAIAFDRIVDGTKLPMEIPPRFHRGQAQIG